MQKWGVKLLEPHGFINLLRNIIDWVIVFEMVLWGTTKVVELFAESPIQVVVICRGLFGPIEWPNRVRSTANVCPHNILVSIGIYASKFEQLKVQTKQLQCKPLK